MYSRSLSCHYTWSVDKADKSADKAPSLSTVAVIKM